MHYTAANHVKTLFSLLLLGLVGCSAESYRRSADIDVNRLLKDRQESTLNYKPREPLVGEDPKPIDSKEKKEAYAKIPVTKVAPTTRPVLARPESQLQFGPLGPVMTLPANTPVPSPIKQDDPYGVARSEERSKRQLVLGPDSPFDRPQRVDLFGAMSYAVVHSRDYQSQSEEMYLRALQVTLERHLLSPRPFVGVGAQFTGGQADAQYQHALNVTGSAGVRQRLPYGGEIVAQTLVGFVNALSGPVESGESAQLVLSGSIPLLRGAGLINLEGLINSERQLIYEIRQFEDYRRSFAVQIASAYFRLLTNQQAVNNRRLKLESLMLLTERTNALYAAGRLNFLEVQRSYQELLLAQNQLIDSQDSYDTAVDDFKVLIGMPVEDRLEIIPVQLQLTMPRMAQDEAVKKALLYRLDLQTARDQIEDARRGVANSQNGLLPDLDLTGSGSVGNRPGTPARQIDGRSTEYSAGIQLDLPIDRVAERNAYRASLIDLDRTRRNAEDLAERITADVRESLRRIRAAEQALAIQLNAIKLAESRLEYSTELLRQGRAGITAREVVESQNSLLLAQDSYETASANLQTQVLAFLRDTGTLRLDRSAGVLGQALDRLDAFDEQSSRNRVLQR